MSTRKSQVLFVCLHGSAKSLIAAELFNRFADARGLDASATSTGTEPDEAIPPPVVKGLAGEGIDVAGRRPRRPTLADVEGSAIVVTFGCELGELAPRARRIERWDNVPAVSENFTRARDAIAARVRALLDDPTARA